MTQLLPLQYLSIGCLAISLVLAPSVVAQEAASEKEADKSSASEPLEIGIEDLVVVSSVSMLRDQPSAGISVDREEIQALPHFGDDFYRALRLLPGASSNDIAAGFNVRGSLHKDVLVRIDGLEIFEPFHLKDFQGVFSVLDPQVVDQVELMPGAFTAEYGDRAAGVLEMTTRRPDSLTGQLGVSFSNIWLGGGGQFSDGRGRWLASLRRGYLDIVLALADDSSDPEEEQPDLRYWDSFGKIDYDLNDRNRLSLTALLAEDTLDFKEIDGSERAEVDTGYGNNYVWGGHQGVLGRKVYADTVLSWGQIDRFRDVNVFDIGEFALLDDQRDVEILGLRQDWAFELSSKQFLKAGFQFRSFDSVYDYSNDLERREFIDDPRFPPPIRVVEFEDEFSSDLLELWVADRFQLGQRFTAELGVRYDRQSLLEDDQISPRVNLMMDFGRAGRLRLGWGHFFQSQRPHELDVEFAETEFQPAVRAEHWNLGWEGAVPKLGVLRAELYRREERDPLRRYETLFDPFQPLPEIAIDIVRIEPQSVVSEGAEIYLRNRRRGKLDWWVGYTWAQVDDILEDGRAQPRWIDQRHALTASLTYRPGRKWTFAGVLRYHSGWPTTAIEAEAFFGPDGRRIENTVGPFYAERLEDYQSFDLRIARRSNVGRGSLTFFLDIQNLFDRENERGLDVDSITDISLVDGRFPVTYERVDWLPILPSFGVSWEF